MKARASTGRWSHGAIATLLFGTLLLAGCESTSKPAAANGTPSATATAPAASGSTSTSVAAAPSAPAAPDPSQAGPPGSGLAGGKPYVVIRFTESSVDYEKPLADAVHRALARKPNLAFDLVAVTPQAKDADDLVESTRRVRDQADAVKKSLNSLGISADRINMETWTGQSTDVDEIRLYIR